MFAPVFKDKVVLITGASTGIGRAAAREFARLGAKVGVNYCNSQDAAESLVREVEEIGGEAFALRADVSKPQEVDDLFARFLDRSGGRLDILVSNAGQWMAKCLIAECPDDTWNEMMDVNLNSVFYCCRAAAAVMKAQQSGTLIITSSIASYTGGGGGTVPYAVAKAGVNTLIRGLAKELAPSNIRVNGIAPGLVDTPMQERFSTPEQLQQWAQQIPLRRIGQPEDIVGAILFLASPLADYVTGEIIEINGGLLMH